MRSLLAFSIAVLTGFSAASQAADFPRRIAVAPFTILGSQDEIRQTVDILPRLMASRLMAMAGAQVLLLPPGEASPDDSAKQAGLPLILRGTVAKLGTGYSIDVTVTETDTGRMAGAFFIAASTEDEIIPRLGDLAADVSEKIFGVRTERTRAPAPAATPPPVLPAPAPAGSPETTAAPVPSAPPAATAPSAAPATTEGWVPSSFVRAGQSDKIADELYGVVAGDIDPEGNGEVIAWGKSTLYIYRVKGTELLPFTRIGKSLEHHFLFVDTIDLDGDGGKEVLVTDLIGERLESIVLKRKGDVYEVVAEKVPYYLVVLPDWQGKPAVVGQSAGIDAPFYGKIVSLRWNGKGFDAGDPLPHNTDILPLSTGIPGLSSARFDKEWNLVYTDETARLRVLDAEGKSRFKSRDFYGATPDFFEWGPFLELEGRRARFPLRRPVRVSPGGSGEPVFLVPEVKKGLLDFTFGSFDSTRLVLLRWDGGEFSEIAGTKGSDHFITGADFLSPSAVRPGGKVVASVIEQMGGIVRDSISRFVLFRLE